MQHDPLTSSSGLVGAKASSSAPLSSGRRSKGGVRSYEELEAMRLDL